MDHGFVQYLLIFEQDEKQHIEVLNTRQSAKQRIKTLKKVCNGTNFRLFKAYEVGID